MKLGSLKDLKNPKNKDGILVVASEDLKKAIRVDHICANLRTALENWDDVFEKLNEVSKRLNQNKITDYFEINENDFLAALPRTWLFADGSSFLYHVKLVRKARNAALPETLYTVPLMYQGESGEFLAPNENIPQLDFKHGTDLEGEVGVIVDYVPMGVTPEKALSHIKLIVLINDVSLRGLIPDELASGFGFFQSKPNSSLSPFAVTPDELGEFWKEGRVHLPLQVKINNSFFGKANAGEMYFHFGHLISHAAKTRNLAAGSLIGSGTVSNENHENGSSCLVEKRMIEQIENGKAETSFLKDSDTVEIQMLKPNGQSIFGRIYQKVSKS